ncbi:MAG TPA: sigma-54 dependent transcriptional regulator [Candidatus Polarisedimenticolia bacterium]|nr:sigma-54 dependent transcriptional regulator [Candidatus Polarisedimenticolia bacterium]
MKNILIAEDESTLREGLSQAFSENGFKVVQAASGREAIERMERQVFDLVVTDLKMPGGDGMDVLKRARHVNEDTPVIIMTAFGTVEGAVEAIKQGAYDYIQKPFSIDELEVKIHRALEHRRLVQKVNYLRDGPGAEGIVGESGSMKEIFTTIEKVAGSNATVLIVGETGTGKELIAEAIHQNSPRRDSNFVKMNCASLTDTLLESELFGHEKGAFTGADRQRSGRFELANEGTLFLDEVGNMSASTQAKVLRAIQEQEFERVGGSRTLKVDVRIIAATNVDLPDAIAEGRFREDLFYRLNVVNIRVPSLRERREDILPLARHFMTKFGLELKRPLKGFSERALEMLMRHDWPGNVRELENTIERAVLMAESDTVTEQDLSILGRRNGSPGEMPPLVDPSLLNLEFLEKQALLEALKRSNWVQKDAAKLLGVSSRVMNYKVAKHGITNDRWTKNRQN